MLTKIKQQNPLSCSGSGVQHILQTSLPPVIPWLQEGGGGWTYFTSTQDHIHFLFSRLSLPHKQACVIKLCIGLKKLSLDASDTLASRGKLRQLSRGSCPKEQATWCKDMIEVILNDRLGKKVRVKCK